ncbi:MAG: hypothetical protein H0V43_05685 [Gemmatimonadales bacterium]|nr:hypothetical protein [Gemmatimonadales bacterium]
MRTLTPCLHVTVSPPILLFFQIFLIFKEVNNAHEEEERKRKAQKAKEEEEAEAVKIKNLTNQHLIGVETQEGVYLLYLDSVLF